MSPTPRVRFLFEPLDDGPGGPDIPTTPRITSRFDSTWRKTLGDLEREIAKLGAREAVIEVDVPRSAIRQDGQMRADTKVRSPRVRVTFTSTHGPLSFAIGRYRVASYRSTGSSVDWQHNLRSIALTLESLRAVDRYQVNQGGEQYTGYLALPAGSDDTERPFASADAAAAWVREQAGMSSTAPVGDAVRACRRELHPDKHDGDRERWDLLEAAVPMLVGGGLL